MLAVCAFALIYRWHGDSDYARRGIFQVGALLLVAWSILRRLSSGGAFWWSPAASLSAGFLALGVFSIYVAADRFASIEILLHWSLCGAFAYVLVLGMEGSRDRLWLFGALAIVASGVAAVGLFQVFVSPDLLLTSAPPGSLFINRNWSAQVVGIALPALPALLLRSESKVLKSLLALALGVSGAYLIHAGARSVWLATLMQGSVLAFIFWRNRTNPAFSSLFSRSNVAWLAAATGAALALGSMNRPDWLDQKIAKPAGIGRASINSPTASPLEQSSSERLALYENTLHLIAENPVFGVGLGNFVNRLPDTAPLNHRALFNDFFWTQALVHNDWLQLWAELGVGFPVFVAVALCIVYQRQRQAVTIPALSPDGAYFAAFNFAGVFGLAVNMVPDFPIYNAMPPILLAVHLAMLERHWLDQKAVLHHWTTFGPSRRFTWGAAVVLAGSMVALLDFHRREFRGEELRIESLQSQASKNWTAMIESATRGMEVRPGRIDWDYLIGLGHFEFALALESRGKASPEYREHLEQAAEHLSRRNTHRPYAYGCYLLGMVDEGLEQFPAAELHFTEALRLFPTSADVYWRRGRLRHQMGNVQGALDDFAEFGRYRPEESKKADLVRARILISAQRSAEAVPLLEANSKDQTGGTESRMLLGMVLVKSTSRKEEGAQLLREFISNPQTSPIVRAQLAKLLEESGETSIQTSASKSPK